MSPARRAFTLIELLVVVAIIVALLAILMPAMGKAIVAAHRTVCLSNTRQQYLAQLQYAGDYFGVFVANTGDSPEYQRSLGSANCAVTNMRGTYIANTDIMICPILADVPGQQGLGIFKTNDWILNAYGFGGWNTNQPNVPSGYMWLGGFRPGYSIQMVNGEPPIPLRVASISAAGTFITHRLNFFNTDALHELVHFGRGYWQDGVNGVPYDDHRGTEMPIGLGDGSTIVRWGKEVKPRMTVGGNYPSTPGYPGTYLW